MKQIIKKINFLQIAKVLIVAVLVLAPIGVAFAQLTPPSCPTGLRCSESNLTQLLQTIINYMLAFTALIALIFLIIGGFRYITAGGNEEAAEKGKSSVVNAVIGLVIIGLSYVIVNVVIRLIQGSSPAA